MLWWSVGVVVSIDTVLALTNLPSRHHCAAQPREPSSATAHSPRQPAVPWRYGWSPELSTDPEQEPLVVCTLAGSACELARAQTGGQDVRLRRQVGRSWGRSQRQSAFYLQACPTTHIARRADIHPDELAPGSGGASPSRLVEPMGSTTMRRYFFTLPTLCRPHRPHRSMVPGTVPVWITHRYEYLQ